MNRTQRRKQASGGLAHVQRMLAVDAITLDGFEYRFPAFRLNLPARTRAAVVLGSHLRQHAVPQAEWRIAKPLQPQAVQQFLIYDGAGHNDLGAPWPDSFDLSPLRHRQPGQSLSNAAHLSAGDGHTLPASSWPQMTGYRGERRRRARGRDDISHTGGADASDDSSHLASHEASQTLEFALARWIVAKKFVGQANRAQGQADGVLNVSAMGDGQLAAPAAEIRHERRNVIDSRARDQPQMNQTRFFHAGDNLHSPSGGRTDPFQKRLRITGVAQRTGGNHPHVVGDDLLGRAVKPAQNFHRFCHRFRGEKSGAEDSLAQSRDLAILVQSTQTSRVQPRNLQADGIRADIDRGECGHRKPHSLHAEGNWKKQDRPLESGTIKRLGRSDA